LVIFANVTYANVTCKSLTLDVVRKAQISLAVVDRFGLPGCCATVMPAAVL
jgi:hypothetical protein